MIDLARLSAEEIGRGVAAGELSASAVIEASLERIEEVEPKVGAFLRRSPESARARARELDARRVAGETLGPLAGVPVALKDNLAIAGEPVTAGSRILSGYVSPTTATAVARLLAADAVIVGKTNLDEFAMGSSCENSAFQVTRNPWHLDMVPGGSSGGSAAAVAAGAVPLALGSDTGGSIRQPAALCGVVGFKPSYGRVSRYGLVAFGSSLDQIGPLARTVRDAALALEVIGGADPRDATAARVPPPDWRETIEGGAGGLRVGVVREIAVDGLEPASRAAWESALRRFADLGAELVEISLPNLPAAIAIYYVVANSEASANLARFDGVRYGRRSGGAASLAELITRSRSEGFGAEVKRRIMLGTFALSSGYYEAYYGRARAALEALRRQFLDAFGRVDLVATPTTPGGAFALGEKVDDPLTMYLSDIFTTPANLAGLPAIAIPCGSDGRGLPLSLQLLGRPFGETTVLRAARAFERDLGWRVAPEFRGAAAAA
jgi:aspartyl-tRNA(Asn)/glutamyl-tRNA(Gln) amidotransferase subunit A